MHESEPESAKSGRGQVASHIGALLGQVKIKAWRLLLETPNVRASSAILRGVWGRALRLIDERAYQDVFLGSGTAHRRLPQYILRPAPLDLATAPAVEWIILNIAPHLESVLWRAWDVACGMGLGSRRDPFRIKESLPIAPDGSILPEASDPWLLSNATWPLPGDPSLSSCRLHFPVPLRLMRDGVLIGAPSLADIVASGLRRVAGFAGMSRGEKYRDLSRALQRESAHIKASPWSGERCDLVRWSGAQQREIELYGVTGGLTLPGGPGLIWPLLAAMQWMHVGKGTVFGMGELQIEPTDVK